MSHEEEEEEDHSSASGGNAGQAGDDDFSGDDEKEEVISDTEAVLDPEEDEVACRVCLQYLSPSDPVRPIFGKIHAGCLRCAICLANIGDPHRRIPALLPGLWRYCSACLELRTLEIQMLALRKEWGCASVHLVH